MSQNHSNNNTTDIACGDDAIDYYSSIAFFYQNRRRTTLQFHLVVMYFCKCWCHASISNEVGDLRASVRERALLLNTNLHLLDRQEQSVIAN